MLVPKNKKVKDRGVKMIIPVRCFSCGKVIGHLYEKFVEELKTNQDPAEVLNKLGVKRYCCRRMLLSHVDLIDEVLKFKY